MHPRILVTGASGFLGQAVTREFNRQGLPVVGMGRGTCPASFDGVWLQQNPFDVSQTLPAVDVCMHLAWPTNNNYAMSQDNMEACVASEHMMQRLHKQGCTHFVVAGTCAEYAAVQPLPIAEDGVLADETTYGLAKNRLRAAMNQYISTAPGLTMSWARIFQVYGPGERKQRLLPHLAELWRCQETFLAANCTQLRDYLHVTDVAVALILLAVLRLDGVYNVCSGLPVSLRDLIMQFGSHFPCGPLVRFGAKPEREGWEPPMLFGDNRKLCALGWRQTISLDQGLSAYAASFMDEFRAGQSKNPEQGSVGE